MNSEKATGWADLTPKLSRSVLDSLESMGFVSPTPVQSSVIPLFLQRKDVAAEAVTGSGKTLAFVIPILEILGALRREQGSGLGPHDVGAVVISPTRELASQIFQVVGDFLGDGQKFDLKSLLFIGGPKRSVVDDLARFSAKGANVIVATPGRLGDILMGGGSRPAAASIADSDQQQQQLREHRNLLLSGLKKLEVLVLDEADRLLSMGFSGAIGRILTLLPKQRRTGLFSATQSKDVDTLIKAGMRNPVLVSVKEKGLLDPQPSAKLVSRKAKSSDNSLSTPSTLSNFYMVVEAKRKFDHLVQFLRQQFSCNKSSKVIVFFSTCAAVEFFEILLRKFLSKSVGQIYSIHRHKVKRDKVFEAFRKAQSGLMVCTDVMARGVDIPCLNWVVQYDPPSSAEAFVHRCGRTARIGKMGSAILFLLPSEDMYVEFVALNQKVHLHKVDDLVDDDLCQKSDGEKMAKEALPALSAPIRDLQMKDKAVFDKATRAFVANVRAYSKHECKWILRLQDLPMGEIASSMGLLRLPKMPELRTANKEGFEAPAELDLNAIKYKDKQKEKVRQEKLQVFQETGNWPMAKSAAKAIKAKETAAWSKQADRKSKKAQRKRKKDTDLAEDNTDDQDLADLEEDFQMLKKFKRGKVSQEEFDKYIRLEDDAVDT